jgi:hypothetical protein
MANVFCMCIQEPWCGETCGKFYVCCWKPCDPKVRSIQIAFLL